MAILGVGETAMASDDSSMHQASLVVQQSTDSRDPQFGTLLLTPVRQKTRGT